MLYHPGWIICLWLVPLFTFFVFPLLLTGSGWVLSPFCKRAGMYVRTRRWPFVSVQSEVRVPVADKRRHPRQKVDGIVAHISDGVSYCEGLVLDISKFGICLKNCADKLDQKAEKLGVLLVGNGKYFQLQVTPKWGRGDGLEESVGAEIEDAHWDWEEFRENIVGVVKRHEGDRRAAVIY